MNLKERIREYYGPIANEYYQKYHSEVFEKACDRSFLDRLIESMPYSSEILDVGSGSSCQQAAYLAQKEFKVSAIDLVEENVVLARSKYPQLNIQVMDMTGLTFGNATFSGITAFYCLGHLPTGERAAAYREFHRVLAINGKLALVVHKGSHDGIHEQDKVYFKAFAVSEFSDEVCSAGFKIIHQMERGPLPDEMTFGRIYLLLERDS